MVVKPKILIVEDELAQREGLARFLGKRGLEVHSVEDGESAIEALQQRSFNLLLTDLRLPKVDGLEVVRRAKELDDGLPMLLMTAYASVDSAVDALRAGAHDYLLKPLILEEVWRKIQNLLEQKALARENVRLHHVLKQQPVDQNLVAESSAMKEVASWIARAATGSSTVLISGETGTGKGVAARAIHEQGRKGKATFLPVNLAAIPEGLIESELFGHQRGAFTGAERSREGILRAAGSGTVFLDEVAELPQPLQAKLLRALESGTARPLGSDREVPYRARIIVATNRDLAEMVEQGTFREDLYYRLNVLHIVLPPLRERPEDIPALIGCLLERNAQRTRMPVPTVSPEAIRCLCTHTWRGNVRELSNVLERAMILVDEDRIEIEHLPEDVRGDAETQLILKDAVERFERGHISTVLRLCEGNRERAAEELGVSPATLYRRLEKLGLKGFKAGDETEILA